MNMWNNILKNLEWIRKWWSFLDKEKLKNDNLNKTSIQSLKKNLWRKISRVLQWYILYQLTQTISSTLQISSQSQHWLKYFTASKEELTTLRSLSDQKEIFGECGMIFCFLFIVYLNWGREFSLNRITLMVLINAKTRLRNKGVRHEFLQICLKFAKLRSAFPSHYIYSQSLIPHIFFHFAVVGNFQFTFFNILKTICILKRSILLPRHFTKKKDKHIT